MLYLWVSPEDWSDKNTALYSNDNSTNRFIFLNGERLPFEIESRKLFYDAKVPQKNLLSYDYIVNTGYFPLVSLKVADLLNDLVPDEVQFVETEIRCKDGILTNYKGLNVTHKIKGIDRKNSIYTTSTVKEEYISGIKYLTCLPGCMGKYSIARDEDYSTNLMVTEKIKLAFENAKITKGINLVTPEDYFGLYSPNQK
ncbi:MAG: DUF1629 domain-containing protein [Pseudomonadota bacterium]